MLIPSFHNDQYDIILYFPVIHCQTVDKTELFDIYFYLNNVLISMLLCNLFKEASAQWKSLKKIWWLLLEMQAG